MSISVPAGILRFQRAASYLQQSRGL